MTFSSTETTMGEKLSYLDKKLLEDMDELSRLMDAFSEEESDEGDNGNYDTSQDILNTGNDIQNETITNAYHGEDENFVQGDDDSWMSEDLLDDEIYKQDESLQNHENNTEMQMPILPEDDKNIDAFLFGQDQDEGRDQTDLNENVTKQKNTENTTKPLSKDAKMLLEILEDPIPEPEESLPMKDPVPNPEELLERLFQENPDNQTKNEIAFQDGSRKSQNEENNVFNKGVKNEKNIQNLPDVIRVKEDLTEVSPETIKVEDENPDDQTKNEVAVQHGSKKSQNEENDVSNNGIQNEKTTQNLSDAIGVKEDLIDLTEVSPETIKVEDDDSDEQSKNEVALQLRGVHSKNEESKEGIRKNIYTQNMSEVHRIQSGSTNLTVGSSVPNIVNEDFEEKNKTILTQHQLILKQNHHQQQEVLTKTERTNVQNTASKGTIRAYLDITGDTPIVLTKTIITMKKEEIIETVDDHWVAECVDLTNEQGGFYSEQVNECIEEGEIQEDESNNISNKMVRSENDVVDIKVLRDYLQDSNKKKIYERNKFKKISKKLDKIERYLKKSRAKKKNSSKYKHNLTERQKSISKSRSRSSSTSRLKSISQKNNKSSIEPLPCATNNHSLSKSRSRSRSHSSSTPYSKFKSRSKTKYYSKSMARSRSTSLHKSNSESPDRRLSSKSLALKRHNRSRSRSRSHSSDRNSRRAMNKCKKLPKAYRRSYSSSSSSSSSSSHTRKRRYSTSSSSRSDRRKRRYSTSSSASRGSYSPPPNSRLSRKRTRYSPSPTAQRTPNKNNPNSSKENRNFVGNKPSLQNTNNTPSTSSRYISQKTVHQQVQHCDNIFTRKSVVMVTETSYKSELKSFVKSIAKQYYEGSDDESSTIDIQVYEDGGGKGDVQNLKNVTKNRPTGDLNHPFYIHPEDVELYQLRTKNGTQPLQALHEICVKCEWNLPTYFQLPSEQGFKFALSLNKHTFVTNKTGQQKKLAKAELVKSVLQWLKIIDV